MIFITLFTTLLCLQSLQALACKIPDPTGHGVFNQYPCRGDSDCKLAPGTEVSTSSLVTFTCDEGYYTAVQGASFTSDSIVAVCNKGFWIPRFSTCRKLCPPLTSLTVNFTCSQGPRLVSCDKPMSPGTVVEFSCKEYHESNEKNHTNGLTCTPSGEWSRPIPYCTRPLACNVPDPPGNRVFNRYPCPGGSACKLAPGTGVPHASLVTVTCDEGYYTGQGDSFSSDSTKTVCNKGVWFPRFSTCRKLPASEVTDGEFYVFPRPSPGQL